MRPLSFFQCVKIPNANTFLLTINSTRQNINKAIPHLFLFFLACTLKYAGNTLFYIPTYVNKEHHYIITVVDVMYECSASVFIFLFSYLLNFKLHQTTTTSLLCNGIAWQHKKVSYCILLISYISVLLPQFCCFFLSFIFSFLYLLYG